MNIIRIAVLTTGLMWPLAHSIAADESPAGESSALPDVAATTEKGGGEASAPSSPSEAAGGGATESDAPSQGVSSTKKSVRVADPLLRTEHRPYRIRVAVALDADPSLTQYFENQFKAHLRSRLANSFGLTCILEGGEIETASWLSPASFSALDRLTEPEIRGRMGEGNVDKMFLLVIRRSGPRFEVACREWDASMRDLGPVAGEMTWDRRNVADAAVTLITHLFRPIFSIEEVSALSSQVRLKTRAGALPQGDPDRSFAKVGDILQPYFRYLDRDHTVQRIQTVPWSYLVVDQLDGAVATCSIVSGLRGALGTGQRRRVELAAIRVQPVFAETRMAMTLRGNRSESLAGHQVLITRKSPLNMAEVVEPEQQVTNRDGAITLTRDDTRPLVWLAVRSGDTLLARVPFLPGLVQDTSLELPDDSLRLSVERDIDMLKGRLVAAVAQRATITGRALVLARAGDGEKALKVLAEADQLPKISDFESELTAIRVPAVEAAQKRRDRVSESRINKLCTQTSDLIRNYLSSDKLRVVQEEVEQLTKPDEPDASSSKKGTPRQRPGRR